MAAFGEETVIAAELTRSSVDSADAFALWVRPHWDDLNRLARRLCGMDCADDVVQEALSAAWRKRAQFDPVRGSAKAWLMAVVADQARKQHRRKRPAVELTASVGAPAGVDEESRIDIDAALARLTHRQRLAVSLYYYLGLPVGEISAVMSCSPGTVKSTLSDARRLLRVSLGDEYA
ncbi:MAG: RNA polymerase sigma factor [Pseudonocardiales bacterium]